jgi:hypothetical protein
VQAIITPVRYVDDMSLKDKIKDLIAWRREPN